MLDMLQLQADIWLVVINTFFTTMDCKFIAGMHVSFSKSGKSKEACKPQHHVYTVNVIVSQYKSTQGWRGLDSFHLTGIFIAWSDEQSACADFA